MYQELALLAVGLFVYSLYAQQLAKSPISGPIIFAGAGLLLGPTMFGLVEGDVTTTQFRVITDLALAFILFVDAAEADLKTLNKNLQLPSRMLLIGLPGVIGLGFVAALLLFEQLSFFEAAILATMLAATDAALGKPVIVNQIVPARVREGLNAESGLNDGLCVPILLVLIAFAEGTAAGGDGVDHALTVVARELGVGLAVGLGGTLLAGTALKACYSRGWVPAKWMHIAGAALAISLFAVAQTLHGSGYVAAFTGGLLAGYMGREAIHDVLFASEQDGEALSLLAWFVFGSTVIGQYAGFFTWQVIVYALLSLTLIRVAPIFLCLTGSGEPTRNKMFMGWFGPRGLASIVFAIIVLNTDLPNTQLMSEVVACTVLFSLIAHGLSANPLSNWLARVQR